MSLAQAEQNCADIRRMVAERGWTHNVLLAAYERLSPDLHWHDKLLLYSELKQIVTDREETKVNDAVLATEARVSHAAP